jgi:hypothetical protein
MDNSKQMTEEYDGRYETAKQIALAAGVLKECEYHEGFFFKGDKGINKALAIANDQYLQGKYDQQFRDKKELDNIIIKVVRKYSAEKCSSCGCSHEE